MIPRLLTIIDIECSRFQSQKAHIITSHHLHNAARLGVVIVDRWPKIVLRLMIDASYGFTGCQMDLNDGRFSAVSREHLELSVFVQLPQNLIDPLEASEYSQNSARKYNQQSEADEVEYVERYVRDNFVICNKYVKHTVFMV